MGSPHNPSSPEPASEQAMDRLLHRLLSEGGSTPKGDLPGRNPMGQISAASTQASTHPGPHPGMNCDWELVAAYAEGQLGRAEREKLEDHLSQCVACRRMANAMLGERPEVAEAAEQRQEAAPWWAWWNWNWAVPALATALIVGSVVFYQRDQILRHAAEDRAAARQVAEKGAGSQTAEPDNSSHPATALPAVPPADGGSAAPSRTPLANARGSEALIPSRDREGAVAESKSGQPAGGERLPVSPSSGDKQTALSDKKEIAGDIRTQTPNAATNAVAEPSDKAEAARALNSAAPPMNNAPQAAHTLPPRLQAIRPAGNSGTYRRDAEAATGGAPPAAANAVGQMEERAAKTLPQAAPLAAGAADSLDLAKKKAEVAPEGLRQTPVPKVAARSAAAPPRLERDSETQQKSAAQLAPPPAAGLAGGVIGGIVSRQPQSFSPLPGGAPLRSWVQRDSRLWAVSDGGRLFRSEDGGRAWRSIPSPTTQDLVSVKWDADANSLLVEDKQGRQYHAEP